MSVQIDLSYEGELRCRAVHSPSQQVILTDAPVDNGGKGSTFSPTDLVAAALGSCMLTIMGKIAHRHQWSFAGASVSVIKEMVADPVRRIGCLRVTIRIPASEALSPADRSLLEKAAYTCPVKQSLHPDTQIEVDWVFT